MQGDPEEKQEEKGGKGQQQADMPQACGHHLAYRQVEMAEHLQPFVEGMSEGEQGQQPEQAGDLQIGKGFAPRGDSGADGKKGCPVKKIDQKRKQGIKKHEVSSASGQWLREADRSDFWCSWVVSDLRRAYGEKKPLSIAGIFVVAL